MDNLINVWCDGHSDASHSRARYGFVAKKQGRAVATGSGEVSRFFDQEASTAELYAVAVALWVLSAGGHTAETVIVWSDNKGMVRNLNKVLTRSNHRHALLFRAVQTLSRCFGAVGFGWIPGRRNLEAHALAAPNGGVDSEATWSR